MDSNSVYSEILLFLTACHSCMKQHRHHNQHLHRQHHREGGSRTEGKGESGKPATPPLAAASSSSSCKQCRLNNPLHSSAILMPACWMPSDYALQCSLSSFLCLTRAFAACTMPSHSTVVCLDFLSQTAPNEHFCKASSSSP